MPTIMFGATPLDCQVCKKNSTSLLTCTSEFMRNFPDFHPVEKDPGHSSWWVKKYCTSNSVDPFMVYFPYLLLMIPLFMVGVEMIFVK